MVWLWKSFKRMTLSAPVFMARAESGEILVLKWLRYDIDPNFAF